MKFLTFPSRQTVGVTGASGSSSGAFDTSSRLDTGAARIRNATIPVHSISKNWGFEHSGTTPVLPPDVTDRPTIE